MPKPRRFRAWLFLVIWIIFTGVLLTFPFRRSPDVVQRGYDKVIHTSLFTVMGIAAQAAAPFVSLLLTVPVAVGLEYVQKKIPERNFSIIDLLANLTGIVLGLGSYELSTRLSTR
jgi:VanZ family protein